MNVWELGIPDLYYVSGYIPSCKFGNIEKRVAVFSALPHKIWCVVL
jgi:hypothetical protein